VVAEVVVDHVQVDTVPVAADEIVVHFSAEYALLSGVVAIAAAGEDASIIAASAGVDSPERRE
jgi:hypothetical protein